MRTEPLHYFLEIAQTGSFSHAARNLYVSQQGLSKSIQALEKELGAVLFERSGKRVHLTEAGQVLVPLAQACVDSDEHLREAMREYLGRADKASGLRLLGMPFITNGVFNLLKTELQACSLRDVVLVERDLADILAEVLEPDGRQGKVAIVGISNKMLACLLRHAEVVFVPLFESSIMLLATKDLVSPRRRSITVEEVSELPIVCYNEPMLDCILKDLFARQPLKNVILNTTNAIMLEEYVLSGRAATFTDSFSSFVTPSKNGSFGIPIKDSARFSVGFIYANGKAVDEGALAYIERFKGCIEAACQAYLAKHPATFGA